MRPSATNPAITRWDADHFVWTAGSTGPEVPPLLVLLPGTGGQPSGFRLIGAVAASRGYRVVGLMYPNDLAVVAACTDLADPGCMGAMRGEIVDGVDRSPHVTVDADNSIDGRLAALLEYLEERHPAEGWDAYRGGEGLRWSMIAVGGLSQGGGHAAFIAQLRPVHRVVMFGAPADGFTGGVAPWLGPGATASARYYGLVHARDPFSSIVPNWIALGMDAFGPLTSVDAGQAPFGGSHMLVTDVLPATGSYDAAHPSVFSDGATPRSGDGSPLLAPVWQYLFGGASRDSSGPLPDG